MSGSTESVDIYEGLADALDALPHGFPRTPPGVERRPIKKAFTPEGASLGARIFAKQAGTTIAGAEA